MAASRSTATGDGAVTAVPRHIRSRPTGRDRRTLRSDGAETRARILAVAERLFAEHGIDAVSTRDIMSAAGTNAAAIHYHFGSRENLIAELLVNRFAALIKEQEPYLERLAGMKAPKPRDVVDAFVLPIVDICARPGGRDTIRLLTDTAGHPSLMEDYQELDRHFVTRGVEAVSRVAGHLSPDDQMAWTVMALSLTFATLGGRALAPTVRRYAPAGEGIDIVDALNRFLVTALTPPRGGKTAGGVAGAAGPRGVKPTPARAVKSAATRGIKAAPNGRTRRAG